MKYAVVASLLLAACHQSDSGPAAVSCPAEQTLDGSTCVPEACGVGAWGSLPVDGNTVYVNIEAAEGGDGSDTAPLTSIQAGVDLGGERGGGLVAVAAGTYVEVIAMGDDHQDVTLAGRCKDLVTIDGREGVDVPAIWITGKRKMPEIEVEGVTVTGGTYTGLWLQGARVSVRASDLRENTVGGVVAVAAEVSLDAVGIYDSQPDRRGTYGRGISVQDGAALVANGCTIQGNADAGVYATTAGTTVDLVDTEVLSTGPRADDTGGDGIWAEDSAAVTATRCTVRGNTEIGVLASNAGTTVDLLDTNVSETSPRPDGSGGWGVYAQDGAALTATACTVQRNTGVGMGAVSEGTTVYAVDTAVLDTTLGPDAAGGDGIAVLDGAELVAERCSVQGNTGGGVHAEDGAAFTAVGCTIQRNTGTGMSAVGLGTSVYVMDTAVLDTAPGSDGAGGAGIEVWDGAAFAAEGCTVSGNSSVGVYAGSSDTMVDLADTAVRGTMPNPEGLGGNGIMVENGAALTATDSVVEGNAEVGVVASGAGTTVALVDTVVLDTALGVGGMYGHGIGAQDGAAVTASGCTIQANAGSGVFAWNPSTTVDLAETEILDNGLGVAVQDGAALVAAACSVQGNSEIGVFAMQPGTTVNLVDTVVLGTRRGRETGFALGVVAQEYAWLAASSLEIAETEGPGLYVVDGTAELDGVQITANSFAGALIAGGSLTLSGATIMDIVADPEWGGGFGIYANDHFGASTLTLLDSTIGPHDYAALWLDGPGTYDIEHNTLSGSGGFAQGSATLHGNAVFAENGVTAWDGATGLLLSGNTFTDSSGIGVLLHGSSAEMLGNSWSNNDTDVRQQDCEDVAPLTEDDLLGVPNAIVCPESNVLVAYDIEFSSLYLPEVESAE